MRKGLSRALVLVQVVALVAVAGVVALALVTTSNALGISAPPSPAAVDPVDAGDLPVDFVDDLPTIGGGTPTPRLPIDLPDPAAAGRGVDDRLVFAHYFPPNPISLDNEPPDSDYYARNYLNPHGEEDKHVRVGGLQRDRPLPRDPIADPQWEVRDLETEIRTAKDAGIDGFSLNIITLRETPNSQSPVAGNMMTAAQNVGGFRIMLMADMTGELGTVDPTRFVDELSQYTGSPAVFRLADGRLVISAFAAEERDVDWWSQVIAIFAERGETVALVPTFLDPVAHMDAFAPISYAMGDWGGRNPAFVPVADTGPTSSAALIGRAHDLGVRWMQPIAVQDARPRMSIYDEAANSTTLRQSWQAAVQQGADWVQIVTWNDYSEGTQIAPSVHNGYALLDLSSYFLSVYKTGRAPEILRDTIYLSHRTQFHDAQPAFTSADPMVPRAGGTPSRDTIEVLVFATASAVVRVDAGAEQYECAVTPGVGTCTFPLQVGEISATMTRDDQVVAQVTSPLPVQEVPAVQDLQYVFRSSRPS